MNGSESYLEAVRAYADGVRVLFAPAGREFGERGGRGPDSYDDLADQAELLAPLSEQVTQEAVSRLAETSLEERAEAQTALLAKVLTDLEVSGYLLQAAQDEEAEAAFTAERSNERGSASRLRAGPYLELLLSEGRQDSGTRERLTRKPRNSDAARAELMLQAGDALAVITARAGDTGKVAFEGLIELGQGEIARAVAVIGRDISRVLEKAEKAARLFDLFRDFLLRAYDSLAALLGPGALRSAADQVKGWVEEIISSKTVDSLLERLYETRQTRVELQPLIQESEAALETYISVLDQVGGLNDAFRRQTDLVDRILPAFKYLTLVPAAALPQGRLLLAAAYILLGGYVILMGGDYVDARKLEKLDRVPGVRRVVERNLRKG